MKLFHGSNIEIEEIDLSVCKPYKDFGQGFYLTDIESQAIEMARRTAKIYDGTPVVNIYDFDEANLTNSFLKVKVFEKPDREWAEFVMRNRSRNVEQPCHGYDIVIGPVADDSMASQFRLVERGYISKKELARRLEYKEFSKQLFFASEKAVKLLKKI